MWRATGVVLVLFCDSRLLGRLLLVSRDVSGSGERRYDKGHLHAAGLSLRSNPRRGANGFAAWEVDTVVQDIGDLGGAVGSSQYSASVYCIRDLPLAGQFRRFQKAVEFLL